MDTARQQHAALAAAQLQAIKAHPELSSLNASWQPVGPQTVASQQYGNVSGRISSIAIDPADTTGNTVYVGTTGGGVWKSINAAGPATSVVFTPLTDTLPVFSLNAGSVATASLSIGALSLQQGVLLAGTGDTNEATDSYYGSGILRSVDGGLTWTLIQNSLDGVAGNHSFVGLGFAGFAWSSSTTGLVVAAVGDSAEGDLVSAPNAVNSTKGLYYSTDAGVTWQMSVIQDGSQIVQTPLPTGGNHGGNAATAVVWNPLRQRFYAAVRYHGYYESADGITWTRLTYQPGTSLTLTACPTNPGLLGNSTCPIFRGALAVQTYTGDTFALTVDANNLDQGLWQDICAGSGSSCGNPITFGTPLASTPLETGSGSTAIAQGDYNMALAAVPSGTDTLLYAGTEDLYRCTLSTGCILRNTTNAVNGCAAPAQVAPAQHALAAMPGTSLLYIGNDGGLWRSTDGVDETGSPCSSGDAGHFQNLNAGLGSLAEVISFAQHPTDPAILLVGIGANGTAVTTSSTTASWPQLAAGEGGFTAIDPANPQNWYISTAAGVSIQPCINGAACTAADFEGPATIASSQVGNDASAIDTPWLLDPALTQDLIIGTCRAWRGPADSGALWSSSNAISRMFGGPQNSSCATANPVVRSLAAGGPVSSATSVQNAGSQVIYAGLAGPFDGGGSFAGHIFATIAAGTASSSTSWTDLGLSPVVNDAVNTGMFNPGGFDVSSIAADPHDATGLTVYATVMGLTGNSANAAHVYLSADGGAHWTNISSNLPNSTANSLAVDPNDANTIYLASDTGVYVTTNVSSCAGGNCWSVYGTGLPNSPAVALSAAVGMATGDGRTGELRVGTYGRGIWQIPLLTAVSPAQPGISLSSTSLTFSTQAVATLSAPQTIVVTNSGNAALTVTKIAATGDFTESDTCTTAPVAEGATCSVQVSFLPAATGTRTGVLTVYGNVSGGQATATLTGDAAPPAAIVLNPVTISFPATIVNATSAVVNVTISNTGGVTASLGTPSVTGDFNITANTCGTTLPSDVGCTVSVIFAPTVSGTRSGSLTVTDDAGTQTVALSGIGNSPATDQLSPLSLTFAPQQLNTASIAQQVTLTNAGDVALTLGSAQITSGDFTVVNYCGNSLNGHSSCAISVAYVPKSIGSGSGILTVSDQFRSQAVTLNGTGLAPPGVSLSPVSALAFAATAVGSISSAQSVTVTNNGGVSLQLQSIVSTGDFTIVAGSNTCGTSIAPGGSCTLQLAFAPSTSGTRSGLLTVTGNATNSPQTLALGGIGIDFSLAANGSTTATIASGKNAVFPLLLTSLPNVTGTVSFTCSGAPTNATCLITPATTSLGTTDTVSVTVNTGVSTTASLRNRLRQLVFLALLLPIGLLQIRRRIKLTAICCLLVLSGCGGDRLIPAASTGSGGSSAGSVTPSGTYPIVVSGTSAGLVHTVNLTLIVQ
jgi:Abnormal spindle-like microcephaly-assoc'd, ASPM-SPD-2-Hydin/Protein of unknown function (DUF1573)